MVEVLYGKEIAANKRQALREKIALESSSKRPPSLVIMVAGDDEASIYYAQLLSRAGQKDGITVDIKEYKEAPYNEFLTDIKQLNEDDSVDAVLVQLPLPKELSKKEVFALLSPDKDVDGQTPENLGRIMTKETTIIPATARAVISILKDNNITIEGKSAVIIGRSTTVGLPAAILMLNENATVEVCHTKTNDLIKKAKAADILIVSAGVPEIITDEYVKENAYVVDVGTNQKGSQMVGDVHFDSVSKIANVSPVIGGVGAVTLASLFENTYELYKRKQ